MLKVYISTQFPKGFVNTLKGKVGKVWLFPEARRSDGEQLKLAEKAVLLAKDSELTVVTYSEVFILRLRRLIAATSLGVAFGPKLSQSDVEIFLYDKGIIYKSEISSNGEVNWEHENARQQMPFTADLDECVELADLWCQLVKKR